jgi:hypothetical protein
MAEKKQKDSAALLGLGDNLVDRRKVEVETVLGERKVKPVTEKKSTEEMSREERKDYYTKAIGSAAGAVAKVAPTWTETKNKMGEIVEAHKEFGRNVGEIVTGTPNMIRKIAKEKGWIKEEKPKKTVVAPKVTVKPLQQSGFAK